jgi:hypothetical membrane protein
MRAVPWWGLLSSAAAPVLLVGGWTIAAQRQPPGFDAVRDTISALAARDAADRWLMTAALLGVGACHVATAAALRPAALPGRVVLAAGGVATVAVALFPLPSGGGRSAAHSVAAAVAFVSLTLWPVGSTVGGTAQTPVTVWALRRPQALAATLGLGALLGWFVAVQVGGGSQVGLAERIAAGAQALWPMAVVLAARSQQARSQARVSPG